MIEINNRSKYKINKKLLKEIAEKVIRKEKGKDFNLSIGVVEQTEIKNLNRKYRKKNQVTNVLSFKYDNNFGEIIICPWKIEKDARKFKLFFKKELDRSLIHGILHLLGYDHEITRKKAEKMEERESYYIKIFK